MVSSKQQLLALSKNGFSTNNFVLFEIETCNTLIFLTGLAFNMAIAVLITFFGDKLNLDLYLAILVAFMIRILANIGVIKTAAISTIQKRVFNK